MAHERIVRRIGLRNHRLTPTLQEVPIDLRIEKDASKGVPEALSRFSYHYLSQCLRAVSEFRICPV
jgi:chemotaxis regulatin CheY-phosphate phosphatase CheZ